MHRLNISLRAQAYGLYHNLVRIVPPNKGERGGREMKKERGAEFFCLLSQNSQTTINQMLFGTSLMACRNDMSGVGACKHIEKKENESKSDLREHKNKNCEKIK